MTESSDQAANQGREPAGGEIDAPGDDSAVITSGELLEGRKELLIQHGDDLYRLRITRNGKLILHK